MSNPDLPRGLRLEEGDAEETGGVRSVLKDEGVIHDLNKQLEDLATKTQGGGRTEAVLSYALISDMMDRRDRRERLDRQEREQEKKDQKNGGVNPQSEELRKEISELRKVVEAKTVTDAATAFKKEISDSFKDAIAPLVSRVAVLEGRTAAPGSAAPSATATVHGMDVVQLGDALKAVRGVATEMGMKSDSGPTTTETATLEGIPVSGSVPAWVAAIPLTIKAVVTQINDVATKFGVFGKPPEGSDFKMPSLTGEQAAIARPPTQMPRPPARPPPPPVDNSPLLHLPSKKIAPQSSLFIAPPPPAVSLGALMKNVKASDVPTVDTAPPPPPEPETEEEPELKMPIDDSLTILKPAIEEPIVAVEKPVEAKSSVAVLEKPLEVVEEKPVEEKKVEETKQNMPTPEQEPSA